MQPGVGAVEHLHLDLPVLEHFGRITADEQSPAAAQPFFKVLLHGHLEKFLALYGFQTDRRGRRSV